MPAGWSEVRVPRLVNAGPLAKALDVIIRDAVSRLEEGQHPMRVRNAMIRDHARAIAGVHSAKLTDRQELVLHVVQMHGPITAQDTSYHLPQLTVSGARAVLDRLERRWMVQRNYTAREHISYEITKVGAEALAATERSDDGEEAEA